MNYKIVGKDTKKLCFIFLLTFCLTFKISDKQLTECYM